MSKYILRLDDAASKMDYEKWCRIEKLIDLYGIKPLVGVIPQCKDPMMEQYFDDASIWESVNRWIGKDWTIALHGFEHVYHTNCGGLNPVNLRSEFAGLSLDVQKEKIRSGIEAFREHGIEPTVFFAPSHTFDGNTLAALRSESNIRIISDTIATAPYEKDGFTFVPQQSGRVRKIPLPIVTFCYHPNMMSEDSFIELETFLKYNHDSFIPFPSKQIVTRKRNIVDDVLSWSYFSLRKIKRLIKQ